MTAEVDAAARGVVDANRYMTLGTADASGRPWVSPVWFATDRHGAFLWVSAPGTRHSRNLAERPQLSIVIFDSTVAVGEALAVYVTGVAQQLTDAAQLQEGIEAYSLASVADGAGAWSATDVTEPTDRRLYRATASECFLGQSDERTPVSPSYLTGRS